MSEGEARSSFWHPEVSNFNEASIVVQLQINGDLENTDNSSIAFWLEQKVSDQPDFIPGPLSGHSADFLGLGVVFSKFKGSESDPEHKELSILVSRTRGDTDLPEGCKVRAACEQSMSCAPHLLLAYMYAPQISPIFMEGSSTLTFKVMLFQDIIFLLHDLYNTGTVRAQAMVPCLSSDLTT